MAAQQTNSEKQSSTESPSSRSSIGARISEPEEGGTELRNAEGDALATDDYPHGSRLAAIFTSLMLAMFLVALDNVGCVLGDAVKRLTHALTRRSSARPFPAFPMNFMISAKYRGTDQHIS